MNIRPYPGLTVALATVLAGTTAPLSAAAADTVEHCHIQAITAEEAAAGMVSEVDCYEVPAGTPMEIPQARGQIIFALIYDGANGGGGGGFVTGASCSGGVAAFAPGSTWDNKISSTELVACGSAKHYIGGSFTGTNQLLTGSGITWNMNATLDNQTSSIQYAP